MQATVSQTTQQPGPQKAQVDFVLAVASMEVVTPDVVLQRSVAADCSAHRRLGAENVVRIDFFPSQDSGLRELCAVR